MNDITRHEIYIAPAGFLDSFDDRALAMSGHRFPRMSMISRISLAAAVVICAITGGVSYRLSTPAMSEHNVTQAFCKLTEADRDFIVETYSEDIFLNL